MKTGFGFLLRYAQWQYKATSICTADGEIELGQGGSRDWFVLKLVMEDV
jgi:hypothetical protein